MSTQTQQVEVTVIVPCLNEERYIGPCLDSLIANDFEHDRMEILVVDGGSRDRTREIVAGYAARHAVIRLLDNPARVKPAALNIGIAQARGEVILCADAHAVYDRDYITFVVQGLTAHGAACFGTGLRAHPGKTATSLAISIAISHPFAVGNAYYRVGSGEVREVAGVFPGCWPRAWLERVGPFNEHLTRTQDREFNTRIRLAGGKVLLDPSQRVTYFPRSDLGSFWSWNYKGAMWLFQARRFTRVNMLSARNFAPALFLWYHALAGGVFFLNPWLGLAAALPLAGYFFMAACFAVQAAWHHRRAALFPLVFLLFPMTHYAYALGSHVGIVRWLFGGRRRKGLAAENTVS